MKLFFAGIITGALVTSLIWVIIHKDVKPAPMPDLTRQFRDERDSAILLLDLVQRQYKFDSARYARKDSMWNAEYKAEKSKTVKSLKWATDKELDSILNIWE